MLNVLKRGERILYNSQRLSIINVDSHGVPVELVTPALAHDFGLSRVRILRFIDNLYTHKINESDCLFRREDDRTLG